MSELVRYDAMLVAVAAVAAVDEIKDLSDKAVSMRLYARQSKNHELECQMADIQGRAMIRLGELSAALDTSKGGSNPEATLPTGGTSKTETLKAAGISKSTANRAEQLAANKDKYEEELAAAKESNKPVIISNIFKKIKMQQNRAEKHESIKEAATLTGSYPVIYADPPWRYEHPPMGSSSRSIENQYPTMPLEEIKALKIPAADDTVLFLWATSPKLAECLEVMKAWGFEYRTDMIWVKDRIGTGYYVRNKHETLLIGKRGTPPAPTPGTQPASVIEAPRGEHSAKPIQFYEAIESMYPEFRGQWFEMFLRGKPREGWAGGWGNEAE